jgi:uncharacterized damage-inducible protein DinB
MQDDVVALFAYDRWANSKVLDACRKLTAQQYVAEPVPGWSSVRSTIYHIALVTDFHLRTLAGDPDDSIPTEADLATVDDAARLLERAYRRFDELRQALTPERLNTVLTLRRRGRTATLPPWAMLRHVPKGGADATSASDLGRWPDPGLTTGGARSRPKRTHLATLASARCLVAGATGSKTDQRRVSGPPPP